MEEGSEICLLAVLDVESVTDFLDEKLVLRATIRVDMCKPTDVLDVEGATGDTTELNEPGVTELFDVTLDLIDADEETYVTGLLILSDVTAVIFGDAEVLSDSGGPETSGVNKCVVFNNRVVERPENSVDEKLWDEYDDVCNELRIANLLETFLAKVTLDTDIVSDERFSKKEILGCTI